MFLGLLFPSASFGGASKGVTLFLTVLIPFMKQSLERGYLKSPSLLLAALQFPSPMFLLAFVGLESLGDRTIGFQLLLLIHGINLSIVGLWMLRKTSTTSPVAKRSALPAPFFQSIAETLTISAVSVIVSSSAAEVVIHTFVLPDTMTTLLYGLLELSAGIELASVTGATLPYYGLVLGFTGMSIHLQNLLILRGSGISFSPYFIARIYTMIVLVSALYFLT